MPATDLVVRLAMPFSLPAMQTTSRQEYSQQLLQLYLTKSLFVYENPFGFPLSHSQLIDNVDPKKKAAVVLN